MQVVDNRIEFVESWLMEMPEGIPDTETYSALLSNIRERLQLGQEPQEVKPGAYKLTGSSILYYWFGTPSSVQVGVELIKTPQSLVVGLLGKQPALKGKPPYATDLYVAVVEDNELSLLLSDKLLSKEGLGVWKQLVKQGYAISAYDTQHPGESRTTLKTPEELEKFYLVRDPAGRRWRYALSKPGMTLWETVSFFNTRRYREQLGML